MKNVHLTYTQPQLDIFFPEVAVKYTIIPKGRRFGATRGAAHACIEWAIEGKSILWGDTISSNIRKYVDRYFKTALKKINAANPDSPLAWDWNSRDQVLTIGGGFIDFRSADRPENWEGFGYHIIILNEAGIILEDPYLYTNAVLPMMMDYPESRLFALGVPKGKMAKDGEDNVFYQLWKSVEAGDPEYTGHTYSSYDNPRNTPEIVQKIAMRIGALDPEQVRQEIWGEFVSMSARKPFAHAFDPFRHVKACQQNPARAVKTIVDFNLDPFCAIYAHVWADHEGPHCWVFKEESISPGTLDEMARRIRIQVPHPSLINLTGDRGGDARRLGIKTNASMFADLIRLIPISVTQLTLRPNPTHVQSREDCNYVFAHHPDLRIDPGCTGLIRDLLTVAVDEDGEIIKRDRSKIAQQADLLDCFRYLVNAFLQDFKKSYKHAVPVGREVR